jgi:hypothetical protein
MRCKPKQRTKTLPTKEKREIAVDLSDRLIEMRLRRQFGGCSLDQSALRATVMSLHCWPLVTPFQGIGKTSTSWLRNSANLLRSFQFERIDFLSADAAKDQWRVVRGDSEPIICVF